MKEMQIPGMPGTPKAEVRKERCATCEYCQVLNAQFGQCRRQAPTTSSTPNPDYVPIRLREGMKAEALKEAEKQAITMVNFPYPWPQVIMAMEWCGQWKVKRVVQVVSTMPQ